MESNLSPPCQALISVSLSLSLSLSLATAGSFCKATHATERETKDQESADSCSLISFELSQGNNEQNLISLPNPREKISRISEVK